MKYFVCSDIHGHFKELMDAVKKSGYDSSDENHKLLVLGDMFDRGPKSKEVFDYLFGLQKKDRAIVVKGNHELFLEEVADLNETRMKFNIDKNGFLFTLNSFSEEDVTGKDVEYVSKMIDEKNPDLIPWLRELPIFFETEHYLFVHAGIDPTIDWKNGEVKKHVWTKSREFRDLDLSKFGVNKTVVHGHVSCRNLRDHDGLDTNDFSIYRSSDGQKIGIDGCVMKTGRINMLIIED